MGNQGARLYGILSARLAWGGGHSGVCFVFGRFAFTLCSSVGLWMMIMRNLLKTLPSCLLALSLLLAPAAHASEAPAGNTVSYINLMPALVGHYALGSKKFKIYKADIALRASNDTKDRVVQHEPLIRDQLIILFSQKTEEDFATLEGKEAVRMEALQRVQQVLTQEEGVPLVSDLLFNNLVVQN